MKLEDSWASLVGVDRVGFPDPDPIHIYTTCEMFKCYHAIRKDYATNLDGCIAQNDLSEIHTKAIFLAQHPPPKHQACDFAVTWRLLLTDNLKKYVF